MIVVGTSNRGKPLRFWSSEGEAGVDGTADCGGVVSRECLGMCPPCGATRHAGALSHHLCAEGAERDVARAGEAACLFGDDSSRERYISYLCRRFFPSEC